MVEELFFRNDGTYNDLANLIKEGYDAGMNPVEVACEDCELPQLIVMGAFQEVEGIPVRIGGILQEIMRDLDLPLGPLGVSLNPDYSKGAPYSSNLIYKSEKEKIK